MTRSTKVALVAVSIACALISANGQWTRQTLHLEPGWNAVHVEVDPVPAECAKLFAGLPVESVWTWNRTFRAVQFLQNPDEMLASQPEWRTWFPGSHPQSFLNNLYLIRAGRSYLVKLSDDAQPMDLTLTGRAVPPAEEWYPDSYNLVGFPVRDGSTLTFNQYFAASPAHGKTLVHQLTPDGTWHEISDTGSATIERGRAYWVWCDGPSDYAGPLEVSLGGRQALEFGTLLNTDELQIRNLGHAARDCTIRVLAGVPPPAASGVSGLAGPLALDYFDVNHEQLRAAWHSFPASIVRQVPAGERWTVSLAVRRAEMAHAPDALYQNILEVTDAAGLRILVPMTSDGRMETAEGAPLPRDGLWVGSVVLNGVSEVNGSSEPTPTSAPLSFRLIVHQDSNGVARLLCEATQVNIYQGGVTNPVILSDGRQIGQYVDPHDFDSVVARFSSVAFGFRGARQLSYSAAEEELTITLSLNYNDPLNPFKHLYHPDHNNLDNYRTPLSEGVESYTVTRAIAMVFSSTPVTGASQAGWGDTAVGGAYSESVNGLYHSALKASGNFILRHVSAVTRLE
jgi:hypothetical protein